MTEEIKEPPFSIGHDADLDELVSLRQRVKELEEQQYQLMLIPASKVIAKLKDQIAALKQAQDSPNYPLGEPVAWMWYEPAGDWNGYEGKERIAFKKPIATEAVTGCTPLRRITHEYL